MQNSDANMVSVKVQRNELLVTCDCNSITSELCNHAYRGITRLMHYHSISLEKYYWPEFFPLDETGNVLELDTKSYPIAIKPKDEYGNIYKKNWGFRYHERPTFDETSEIKSSIQFANKQAVGFAVVWFWSQYPKAHLPFLLPFVGKLNGNSTDFAGYTKYLRRDKESIQVESLTDNQLFLEEMGFQMFQMAKQVGRQPDNSYSDLWIETRQEFLASWKEIVPALSNENFVISNCSTIYPLHDRPRKMDSSLCTVSMGRYEITILLKEHKQYFSLSLLIKIGNDDITHDYKKAPLFIINSKNNSFHLVKSIQDEKLVNFFSRKSNATITVLKKHFDDFHKNFLSQVCSCYPVVYQKIESKRYLQYSFADILKSISE